MIILQTIYNLLLLKRFLSILLICINAVLVQTAPHLTRNYAYRYFTTRDGLAQMQVLSAFQDRDGYMWFGTKGGVSRFDGVSFKNYTSENGLPEGEVRTIAEWNDKIMFFYESKIVLLYPNDKIEIIKLPEPFLNTSRETLTLDLQDKNRILILDLTKSNHQNNVDIKYQMLFDIRTKQFQLIKGFNGEVLKHNDKLFMTRDGLYSRTGLTFKCLAATPYKIKECEVDWERMEFYFYNHGDDIIKKYNLIDGKFCLSKIIENVNKQLNGYYFKILPDHSLLYFDKNNQARFLPERNVSFNINLSYLERIYIDREKNIWLTTNNGLYNFFNLNFEEVKLNLADPDDVWSVLEDNDYNMWFGSYGKGLWKMDTHGKLTHEFESFKYSNLQYMGSSKSKDGTLYFPTAAGVIKYKKGTVATLTNTAACLSVLFDEKAKRQFFSGVDSIDQSRGLFVEAAGKRKYTAWSAGLPVSIIKDTKGQIRLGAFHGQGIYRNDSIITDKRKHEYEGVISMATDDKGRIWKGTNKGVYVEFPDGMEKRVSPTIITGYVTSLMVYHNKYVLAGGLHSLFVIDDRYCDSKVNPQVWEIGYDAGFTGLESGQNGFCEDHNGDVWLTTALSVLKINPERLVQSQSQLIPNLRLASISYSKDNANWNILVRSRNLSKEDVHNIELNSSDKFLRFDYVANSISAPKSLRFRYRLVGFSDNWSETVYSKSASYTNIGYGKYRFEVKCSLDGIHWSSVVQSAEIEITVPPLLRPLAFIAYLLILILLSIYITRVLVKRAQQKKMVELNRMKLENELQLNTLRSKIIPHFTKNVLSAIGYFAMTDKLKAGHYISLFSEFTQSTLSNADRNYISLKEELKYIQNYLELEKMRFGDKFDFQIQVSEEVSMDLLIPTMTLHTYCDNAIRHGLVQKDGLGLIKIEISANETGVLITVVDNGIGRKMATLRGTRGNGQGLKLIQAQLDFYNQINEQFITQQIIDLEDSKSNPIGTRVELFIPVGYRFKN